MENENKDEINQDEVVEKDENTEQESVNQENSKQDDRPEHNWRAEVERKNREIEKLRQEREKIQSETVHRRDPNDMNTWADHELKAIKYSQDAKFAPLKDEADEILLDRKIERMREKERAQDKRTYADAELRRSYPEALSPGSELAVRMEELLYEYDLQKSPAGRLAAAKMAAAELGLNKSKTQAKERKAEADRVARVKGQMVDGDRSKSNSGAMPAKKIEEIEKKLRSDKTAESGISDVLDMRGIRQKFGKVWGE